LNKFIVLISLSNDLGGAQIRSLTLFNEISNQKKDYSLIINRKLFDIAVNASYLDIENTNIIILEIDKYSQLTKNNNIAATVKNNFKYNLVYKKLKILKNSIISIKKLFSYTYKLHLIFKNNPPSYVYALWKGGMITWPLKYFYNFKFTYSFNDSGFSSMEKFWGQPLKSEQMPLKHSDTIDFLSGNLLKGVEQRMKLNKNTNKVISCCSFKNYDKIKSAAYKSNTITFCSRMTKIKNPMLLLKSILVFNEKYKRSNMYKFQFLGDGECFNEMTSFANKYNLSNVELLGNVNNPVEFMSKSKIFVSIQQANNYPSQSLLEAMACENAIIASDVGETRKLVTEKEGLLINLKAEEIADAIIELVNDEEKMQTLGKLARSKVMNEHTVEKYLEYFYSLEKLN
jgi:glycosyltransferase involved in cell wall biosynthesis